MNRKEQFYSATVLPFIVASDGFAHLHRFLGLCGLSVAPMGDHMAGQDRPIEFFTEYNFLQSRFTDRDNARFPGLPPGVGTPDLVIVGSDWLLVVEAKMFHTATVVSMREQMDLQRGLVAYWAHHLSIPSDRVAHVLLAPEGLPTDGLGHRAVTWEEVLEQYRVVGPAYWTAMLRTALDRYEELRSTSMWGENVHGKMRGVDIVAGYTAGDLPFTHMGRTKGLTGQALAGDVATGKWVKQRYEVRHESLPGNANWFPIHAFVDRVTGPGT